MNIGGLVFNVKSDENKSTVKISEYDEDEHVRDGNYDPDYIEEMFDETNEVHDEWSYSIWLSKINSIEFLQNLVKKYDECLSKFDGALYLTGNFHLKNLWN